MTTDTALAVTKRVIDDGCMFLLLGHRIIDTIKCRIVALDKIPYVVRSLFMEFFSSELELVFAYRTSLLSGSTRARALRCLSVRGHIIYEHTFLKPRKRVHIGRRGAPSSSRNAKALARRSEQEFRLLKSVLLLYR